MYRVDIGDCFLLTIEYDAPLNDGRNDRHVLIDFGSFRLPEGSSFPDIASLIAKHCGGKLDVVVASHRDKDHIAGFADREAFQVLRHLSPSLVVRPWMDDPGVAWAGRRVDTQPRGDVGGKAPRSVVERASRNLLSMCLQSRLIYLQVGRARAIERELPGTQVLVMGPPGRDAWHGRLRSVNNSSLILFFTVTNGRDSKCLLFPGDAEVGSWSKALQRPESRRLLEQVDLYKIGHHGSETASPPELFDIWKQSKWRHRIGLLSTRAGVFGAAQHGTEVPSRRVLNNLRGLMDVVSTQQLPRGRAFVEVAARVSRRSPFTVVEESL
jgi:hypothetical protein